MKKLYILIILLLTCFLFSSCNKKQINNENSNQPVVEGKKEETKTNTTANDSQQAAVNNNENNTSKEQTRYNLYKNPRYGFSIEYPDNFKKGENPTNGDGLAFSSSGDNAKLTVYGSNNIFNETAQSALNSVLKDHPDAPYKQQEGNWFVASWIEGDRIVYHKSVVGSGSSNTFTFEYPVSKKEYYDPIVTRINSSFKTPGVSSSH